jgi:glycosyltransferase involved in cell wall biosynthesis
LPHNPIFLDDLKIRRYLVRSSDVVVALSEGAKEEIKVKFEPHEIVVIPEGPLFHPTTYHRIKYREKLQVPAENLLLVSLGSLASYKGIADLLKASHNIERKISIRVAGWCDSKDERELKAFCEAARSDGEDIQIAFGELTKNEYGAYLQAADFYVAPFRVITNSGSVNAALSAGLPVVIPNLPSLQWVPKGAAVVYQSELDSITELAAAINSLTSITDERLIAMQSAANAFTDEHSWKEISEKHIRLYQKIMQS